MIYKFTAKWCSSCLLTNKEFTKLIQDYQSIDIDLEYLEIDVDSENNQTQNLLQKFGIDDNSILPVIVFVDQNKQEIDRSIGEKNRSELISLIDKHLLQTQNKTSPSSNFNSSKSSFLSKLNNIFK